MMTYLLLKEPLFISPRCGIASLYKGDFARREEDQRKRLILLLTEYQLMIGFIIFLPLALNVAAGLLLKRNVRGVVPFHDLEEPILAYDEVPWYRELEFEPVAYFDEDGLDYGMDRFEVEVNEDEFLDFRELVRNSNKTAKMCAEKCNTTALAFLYRATATSVLVNAPSNDYQKIGCVMECYHGMTGDLMYSTVTSVFSNNRLELLPADEEGIRDYFVWYKRLRAESSQLDLDNSDVTINSTNLGLESHNMWPRSTPESIWRGSLDRAYKDMNG